MKVINRVTEKGVYKGGKPFVDIQRVRDLRDGGMGASAIAKELGIGSATVFRALNQ